MKSIRLNKAMKEQIINCIVNDWKENNKEPDLDTAKEVFAEYLWETKHGKIKDKIKSIPKGMLNQYCRVEYTLDGQVWQIITKNQFPHDNSSYNDIVAQITSDDSHYIEYEKIRESHEKWRSEIREIKRDAGVILASVNTSTQLLEVWPESEKFLQQLIKKDSGRNLPSVPISELNKRLGLKPNCGK